MTARWMPLLYGIREVGRSVADALLPQTCLACGEWIPAGSGPACQRCADELAVLTQATYCPRCGRTMPPEAIHAHGCARCLHESFWNVAAVARIGPYEGPLRTLITGLKYAGHERNAEFAAAVLADRMRTAGWATQIALLVPVPMSWLRRAQRPCDHAALLARAVGRRLKIDVGHVIKRLKHTPSQTNQTSRHRRFENVRDCFGLKRHAAGLVAGRTVCIVDNLITSGATVCELSKVLRRAGARKIYAAVIARTVLAADPDVPAGMRISAIAGPRVAEPGCVSPERTSE